jgi:hypothetical protein
LTGKRELESVSSILMLLAGIFLLLDPIQTFARDIQRGTLNVDLVAILFGILALVSFAITWKGNSTVGGLLSLILSLYLLFGRGAAGFEATSAAFLLAAGIIAMLAGRSPTVYAQR